MKSTGEVMGRGVSFGEAFGKALRGAGDVIPTEGNVFLSVKDTDKNIYQVLQKSLLSSDFSCSNKGSEEILSKHKFHLLR